MWGGEDYGRYGRMLHTVLSLSHCILGDGVTKRRIQTNTLEGYHRMFRKVTKFKGAVTSETAVLKLVYLANMKFNKIWQNRVFVWTDILHQITLIFEDRINKNDTLN